MSAVSTLLRVICFQGYVLKSVVGHVIAALELSHLLSVPSCSPCYLFSLLLFVSCPACCQHHLTVLRLLWCRRPRSLVPALLFPDIYCAG